MNAWMWVTLLSLERLQEGLPLKHRTRFLAPSPEPVPWLGRISLCPTPMYFRMQLNHFRFAYNLIQMALKFFFSFLECFWMIPLNFKYFMTSTMSHSLLCTLKNKFSGFILCMFFKLDVSYHCVQEIPLDFMLGAPAFLANGASQSWRVISSHHRSLDFLPTELWTPCGQDHSGLVS